MRYYLAWAGLVCVLVYTLSQWREIAEMFSRPAGAVRHAGRRQHPGRPRHPRRDQLHRRQAEQALGPDREQAVQPSDQSRNVLAKLDSPLQITVFAQEPEFRRYRDRLKEYQYALEAGRRPSTSIRTRSRPSREQNQVQQYGTIVFDYKGRTERVTADTEQDLTNAHHQGGVRPAAEGLLHAGTRRKDTASADRDGYNAIAQRSGARTTPSRSWCSRSRARCPTMRPS